MKHLVYASGRQQAGYVTNIGKREWLCEANYYHKDKGKFQLDVVGTQPTRKKAEAFLIRNWYDNYKLCESTGIHQLEK
jgi:hypothetical protein|tara:strand:+ start:458 stop:691 length:234 start_codon:yes stop_codon:yes gene_type:complete